MRVLVTGARGYIGAVLAPRLVERGHEVVCLDVGWFEGHDFDSLPQLAWTRKDVRDLDDRDLAGSDAVVHLAALSNDPLGDRDERVTWEINYAAAVRLARTASRVGVERFVFASSCSVYGALNDGEEANEQTPAKPLTAYARAKVAAEEEILALASAHFCPVVLRFATVYGPSPRLRLDLVVNQFAAFAVTSEQIVLRSNGAAWRPFVHTSDVARAVAAVLEAPACEIRARILNVGRDDANVRVRDLASLVAAVCPGTRVLIEPGAAADQRTYRVSFAAWARAFPAAVPRVALREGVRDLIQRFRERGLGQEELLSKRFDRLAQLEELERAGKLSRELRWQ